MRWKATIDSQRDVHVSEVVGDDITRCAESGTAAMFMTTLEKSHANKNQSEQNKRNGGGAAKGTEEYSETPKIEKDMSKVKYYNCREKGHISLNFLKKLQEANEGGDIKTTWKDKDDKEIKAAMYCTMCDKQEGSMRE
jgi:hypothetical protein